MRATARRGFGAGVGGDGVLAAVGGSLEAEEALAAEVEALPLTTIVAAAVRRSKPAQTVQMSKSQPAGHVRRASDGLNCLPQPPSQKVISVAVCSGAGKVDLRAAQRAHFGSRGLLIARRVGVDRCHACCIAAISFHRLIWLGVARLARLASDKLLFA